jgi:hypothetical protein
MARSRRTRNGRGVAYRYLTVAEEGLEPALRSGIAALLEATLDDGAAYRERAWRTLRPAFRVVALAREEPPGRTSLVCGDGTVEGGADEQVFASALSTGPATATP